MVMVIISWICQTAVDYVAVAIGHYFISTTDYLLPRLKLLVGDCAHVCVEKVEFPERDGCTICVTYLHENNLFHFLHFTTSGIYTSSLTKARVSSNPCISSLLCL